MQTQKNQPNHRTDALFRQIANRLIRYMQSFDACRLLIDHNPSRTLWDEVCILVHTADSVIWGYYVGTMEIIMSQYLNELPQADQLTLWIQTEEAQDWQLRSAYFPEDADRSGRTTTNDPPIDYDDITSHLLHNYIYPAARRPPRRLFRKPPTLIQ